MKRPTMERLRALLSEIPGVYDVEIRQLDGWPRASLEVTSSCDRRAEVERAIQRVLDRDAPGWQSLLQWQPGRPR